jgi:hypothetical protein
MIIDINIFFLSFNCMHNESVTIICAQTLFSSLSDFFFSGKSQLSSTYCKVSERNATSIQRSVDLKYLLTFVCFNHI